MVEGELMVVRYADGLVVGFEHRAEAERFLREFRERLAKFGRELHPDKTRLIEFGKLARQTGNGGEKENRKASHSWGSRTRAGPTVAGTLPSGGRR